MISGVDSAKPARLMEAMKALLAIQRKVHSFVERLSKDNGLAVRLDTAVMKSDHISIEQLLRDEGLDGDITIRDIDPDRMIVIAICAGWTEGGMSCSIFTINW